MNKYATLYGQKFTDMFGSYGCLVKNVLDGCIIDAEPTFSTLN